MRTRRTLTQRVDKLLQSIQQQERKEGALSVWEEDERVRSFFQQVLFGKIVVFHGHCTEHRLSESELQEKMKQVDHDVDVQLSPEDRAARRRYLRKYRGYISGARDLLLEKLRAFRRKEDEEDDEDLEADD